MSDNNVSANDSGASGDVNALTKSKQKKIGIVVVGGFLVFAYLLVNLTSDKGPKQSDIKSDDLTRTVTRAPGDKDSFAVISGQVNGLLGEMDKFKETSTAMNQYLEAQGDQTILKDIQSTVNGNASDLEDFRGRLKKLETQALSAGARGTFGQGSDGASRTPVSRDGSGAIPARPSNSDELFGARGRQDGRGPVPAGPRPPVVSKTRTQNVIDLFPASDGDSATVVKEVALKGAQVNVKKPDVFDTENYVPPNAYVSARLVVSVDAAIGQSQASDPKAAQFIITGAARHVQDGNKIEETELEGCLVNGSAQGNLSSERVFINLHAMTCPLGEGRVAVSKVEGYATHLGKNGIRGTVVSREGDLVTKSIIAGTLGGLGRTAQQFGNPSGFGSGAGGALISERPSTEEILGGSLGAGVGAGADVYSNYLLERARAYEPVVSLPTGIEVELVFISGTLVRPLEE